MRAYLTQKSILILVTSLLIFFSCKKEEENKITPEKEEMEELQEVEEENQEGTNDTLPEPNFFIPVDIITGFNVFISVTNQDEEVLFDTVGIEDFFFNGITDTIAIFVEENDIVDITLAIGKRNQFDIETYRNIPSGFSLNSDFLFCDNDFSSTSFFKSKEAELHIEGITGFSDLNFPMVNRQEVEVDFQNNKLIVRGRMGDDNDHQFTLFDTKDNSYKIFIAKFEDWSIINEDSAFLSINIADFNVPKRQVIDLGHAGNWFIDSKMLTSENRIINTNFKNAPQEGTSIQIFTHPEYKIDKISLMLRNISLIDGGFEFYQVLDELPNNIPFFNPKITLNSISNSNYSLAVAEDYDLAIVEYYYSTSGILNSWRIFQKPTDELIFRLPKISDDFVELIPVLENNVLNFPDYKLLSSFKFIEGTGSYNYTANNIERQFDCQSHFITKTIVYKLYLFYAMCK